MATETGDHAIETMFLEERTYPPPEDFAAQANAQPDIYDVPFEEFWEREGRERVTWFEPFSELYEWEPPYAKWYLGGKLNVCFNCVDRHVEAGAGDKVAFHWEGEPEGETRTITYADLQKDVVRFANALKKLGVKKGTPVGIYMGMVPELPVAMLACTRLGAPHTVVFGGFSADSLSGRMNDMKCELLITQDEAWRRGSKVGLKTIADEAMADAPGVKQLRRPPPHRRRRADAGRPRPLVARPRERRLGRSGVVPVRADGQRGPALPHVHERHDREAEGDHPHDGRLPRRHVDDAQLHLRPEAGRGRLLVRRRHRLDHRPQLHRLRAALQPGDVGPLRGDARLPRQGPLVVDRREVQGDDPLHGADGDPLAHEVGAGVRAEARPLVAAAARLGRRADQPGGVDLVPRAHRRRPDPDRRHLVADRDRDDPDHAAAGGHDAQAGLGDPAVPGRRAGRLRRAGQRGRAGRGRLPRPQAPVAGDAARHLRRRPALPRDVLVEVRRTSTSPATAPGSTRTATTGCSAASTT